jgi:hypothetical protein
MQFILTQEELDAERKTGSFVQNTIDNLCQRIANSEILPEHGNEPWGCIKDNHDRFCDNCPVLYVCKYSGKEVSQ